MSEEVNSGSNFKCKKCSCTTLIAEQYYFVTTHIRRRLQCKCGERNDNVAALDEYCISAHNVSYYDLTENHHYELFEREEIEKILPDQNESNLKFFCEKCYDESDESDWNDLSGETEEEEDGFEWYVKCKKCGREIEFGWSHPDRGGRIWPSEMGDFNPWICWPEPRYRDSWTLSRGF